MASLSITLALLAVLVLGCGILRHLGAVPRSDRAAYWGWAWLCGCLGTALLALVWLALGKPLDGRLLGPITLFGGGALLFAGRNRTAVEDPFVPARRATWYWVVVGALLLWALDGISFELIKPVLIGDEANIWASKGKAMMAADGLGQDFARKVAAYPVNHADYPILVPLLHVWIHAAAGEPVHIATRLPQFLTFVAFVLVLASALRRVAAPAIGVLVLLVVIGADVSFRLATDAGADGAVALGILVAVDSYRRWFKHGEFLQLALCALGLGFAAWGKNEGLMLVLVFVIAVVIASRIGRPRARLLPAPLSAGLILLVPLGLVIGQRLLNGYWGFENDLFAASAYDQSSVMERVAAAPARLGTNLDFFTFDILLRTGRADSPLTVPASPTELSSSRLILALCFVSFLASPIRGLRPMVLVPVLLAAGAFTAHFLIFLITPHELGWHLVTAAQRVVFQFTPVAGLALAAQLTAPDYPLEAPQPDAPH